MVATRWAVAVVVGATVTFIGAPWASAASKTTQAFLANVVPNVDFLDRSSRLAIKNSKNARLRDFAFGMAREQTFAADAVFDWTTADKKTMTASASVAKALNRKDLDRSITSSVKTESKKPESLKATPHAGVDHPADDRLARGQEDLDSLEGLEGKAFDAEYLEKQKDALQQIETDYRNYSAEGDDPALKGFATRQLGIVQRRLAQVSKF